MSTSAILGMLDQYEHVYYNNNCSIIITEKELALPGFYEITKTDFEELDLDLSGAGDITSTFCKYNDVKLVEIFIGDDHNNDSYFTGQTYLCITPASLMESLKKITDKLFSETAVDIPENTLRIPKGAKCFRHS